MIEAGLYSILVKWGLDSVSGIIRDKDPQNIQILLEAIKTRNALVLKRFDFAWLAAQEVVELNSLVETELSEFIKAIPVSIKSKKDRLNYFIPNLCDGFHPPFHRKLREIRSKFEATNDLFSAYSIEFYEMLRADNLESMLRAPQHKTVSDAARTYRQLWSSYGAVMLTLIRVSSSDLRFWLTDAGYFLIAKQQAKEDRKHIESHFQSGSHESWNISIEDSKAVKHIWKCIEQSTRDA